MISPRTYPQPALEPSAHEELYFLGNNGAARVLAPKAAAAARYRARQEPARSR